MTVEGEALRRERRGRLLEQRLRLPFQRPAALGFEAKVNEALACEIDCFLAHDVSPAAAATG